MGNVYGSVQAVDVPVPHVSPLASRLTSVVRWLLNLESGFGPLIGSGPPSVCMRINETVFSGGERDYWENQSKRGHIMLRLPYNTLALRALTQPKQHCCCYVHCVGLSTFECCCLKRRKKILLLIS